MVALHCADLVEDSAAHVEVLSILSEGLGISLGPDRTGGLAKLSTNAHVTADRDGRRQQLLETSREGMMALHIAELGEHASAHVEVLPILGEGLGISLGPHRASGLAKLRTHCHVTPDGDGRRQKLLEICRRCCC